MNVKKFAVLPMVAAMLAMFGVPEVQAVGGFSYSRSFKDFTVKVESPITLGIAPMLDAIEYDAARTRVEALLKEELESRYKNKEVHVAIEPSDSVKAQTINGALKHYAYFDTNIIARSGEGISHYGAYPTLNGVIAVLQVGSFGSVQLDALNYYNNWQYVDTTTKKRITNYVTTGYPGYYGASATCLKKKCSYSLFTYLLE